MARIKVEDWLTDDGLRRLELFKRRGYTDKQIAKKIGISETTFTRWKRKEMSILNALKKGKQSGIDQVEVTMFDKAVGYTDAEGVYHPPETTAGIFILKNQRRDEYSDRPLTKLEKEKLKLEVEKLQLENEKARKGLSDEDEKDQLDRLLEGVDNATIVDAKEVS